MAIYLKINHMNIYQNAFFVNGFKTVNKIDIVNEFNEYFSNMGPKLAASITSSSSSFLKYLKSPNSHSFALHLTNPNEVINIVSNFKNKNSAGHDLIPVNVMKATIANIANPISKIINCSFQTGIFPDTLKIARVCPIFKSGEKDQNFQLQANFHPSKLF